MNAGYIYKLTNKTNGKWYIGSRRFNVWFGVDIHDCIKDVQAVFQESVDNFLKSSANLKYIPTAIRSQASETRKVQRLSPMGEYTVSAVEAEDTHVSG